MKTVIFKSYGTLEVHDHYVVAIMKEGITVKPEYNDDLLNIVQLYFKGKDFGYITHRKNSYSVDPRVYFETTKIKNLVAFAVVSADESQKISVSFEREFLRKPFEFFNDLDTAKAWVVDQIKAQD